MILVNCLVASKLNYCNSLLHGAANKLLTVLQRLQNRAARIITHTPRHHHISGVRKELHWLPVKERIEYKVLLLCFKALKGLAPSYLSDLLEWYVPPRSLRSTSKNLLKEPRSRLKNFGDRSFRVAAPKLWNKLPDEMRKIDSVDLEQFKRLLKTHLFKQAYDCQ